ncbi:MAG TPA: TlpA disulfide reductase family protein [Alphaproteobacteria bacterium]|nr:TlpA disulfide reductase family protein [Alphaproteobacteria bacterium]
MVASEESMSHSAKISVRTILSTSIALFAAGAVAIAVIHYEMAAPPGDKTTAQTVAPGLATSQGPNLKFTFSDRPEPLPDLQFSDGDGHPVRLTDFRGKAVLLNIWATWCVTCRQEMPALDRLQSKLGGSQFEVLALSIDRQGKAVVEPFYRELGLTALAIYIDQSSKATQTLHTLGVPTTLLIDRDGREVARKMGAAEWDSPEIIETIRRHIGQPSSTEATVGPANRIRQGG